MRRAILFAGVLACLVASAACASGGSGTSGPGPTDALTTTTAADSGAASAASDSLTSKTVWLCHPGLSPNPCQSSLDTTVIAADGSMRVKTAPPTPDPKVDCFYVYPTVSQQKTNVADLTVDPAETSVAIAQASRFSQVCRVYAPMYRQMTINAIFGHGTGPKDRSVGQQDVQAAWADYLAHENHGRGVILIGHSQGSFVLTQLIAAGIDNNPAVRKLLVAAFLLGGNVTVANGRDVGGSFQHVPVCRSSTQTGCVVAYSTFLETPVAGAIFGRSGKGTHVVCVNPAAPGGGVANLDPYYPVGQSLLGGIGVKRNRVKTPWVEYPDLVTGRCEHNATHTWLQITDVRKAGDHRLRLTEALGPTWGLHLVDVNVAYGNLVALAGSEAQAWAP